ncbi:Peroxidase superfamily protein [Trifolium repens]|nr:Peroxidase superfamily protein [Trifolium repens]
MRLPVQKLIKPNVVGAIDDNNQVPLLLWKYEEPELQRQSFSFTPTHQLEPARHSISFTPIHQQFEPGRHSISFTPTHQQFEPARHSVSSNDDFVNNLFGVEMSTPESAAHYMIHLAFRQTLTNRELALQQFMSTLMQKKFKVRKKFKGCDASILIDSQKGNQSEKDAGANRTVRGYNLIDEVKRILENVCPLTVSCADIIALATRDSVVLAGGPSYNVPTGRHDGLVSSIHEVNLPGPESSIKDVLQVFNSKGMTMEEMVILLGAHTVGFTHCSFIKNRINNQSFLMDNDLRKRLVEFCGVEGIVTSFARNGESFLERFADAMIKLGKIDVLVGNQGEIRKNCRVFN